MTFFLVLIGVLGLAAIGEYDSDEACKAAAQSYAATVLGPEQTSPKQAGKLVCIGRPTQMPGMREISEA